jgi:hypothetical protein
VLADHYRNRLPAEMAADANIVAAVKAEADRTRVAPAPGPGAGPAPPAASPAATTIDALERPLYFLYHGLPYGTGPDIPGGRR